MTKNYMPDVARILGVELGEEFNLKDCSGEAESTNRFKITMDGLHEFWDNTWMHHDWIGDLLLGEYEIIKLPWKPKNGDKYYTYYTNGEEWLIWDSTWDGSVSDYARLKCGIVFRTNQEALSALPQRYKELTGKELKQ